MSTAAMTTWQFPPPVYRQSAGGNWPLAYWLVMLGMWWVMMIAMMVPSAAPAILLYARVYRHNRKTPSGDPVLVPTAAFLAGYLLAWLLFSLAATGLQWGLERAGLVHTMMWSNSHILSAVFLLAAGVYQLTPLKNRCLDHCRNPVAFLSSHWRPGRMGALRMGLDHGVYCVGCCWVLMLLLFAGGIMNLVWIAALAIMVLLEKRAPPALRLAPVSGVILVLAGSWLLLH